MPHGTRPAISQAAPIVAQPKPTANLPSSPAAAPESPAKRLIAQAHEWSSSAKSEDEFSRIIETCRQAQASQPDHDINRYANELTSWALNRRGQLKAEAGRDTEAIGDFDEAVTADPQRWRAIHNRGVLLAQAGEFEKAFDDFNRTIEINPQFAKAYSNRAALFVVAGNLEPAMQDYARAIELDPKLAVAHRGCGRACHLLGDLEEAVRHYDESLRLAPDDAYAVASRADVLTDLGRYAEAAQQYDRAIEIDPNSSQAHSGSAWLLATCPDDDVRNAELAIDRAERAIELTGREDAATFDTLAAAHANAGDFAAAARTARQAVQLAAAEEREAFQERLLTYQREKPFRIAPFDQVIQASYDGDNK
jgi:tetratricopeptide (TPR) repeat protein